MRPFYQTHWQGIAFSEFCDTSSNRLADSQFYSDFYKCFFSRYKCWDELSIEWRLSKQLVGDFLISRGKEGTVLSVGCGLGFVEHHMKNCRPEIDLYLNDIASTSWAWIEKEIPSSHRLVGMIPSCLPEGFRANLIYLCAVDYAMDDEALIKLLASLRSCLKEDHAAGECILISASFDDWGLSVAHSFRSALRLLKSCCAAALDILGLRSRGQFWGWERNCDDYRRIMAAAGFESIEDGFIGPIDQHIYWIRGC